MTDSPEAAGAAVPQAISISPAAAAVHADFLRDALDQRCKLLTHLLLAEQTKSARLEARVAELTAAGEPEV